jgi:hypothetical protein
MYIAKLNDGPKRAKKIFSMILERVFKMVWWRGENHIKKEIFEVEVFFFSQNTDFPFIWRDSWSFSFSSPFSFFLFFNTFSLSFFYSPSLEDLGVLMIFEKKITSSKTFFLNGLTCNGMVMTVDILVVDTYFRMELCTPI